MHPRRQQGAVAEISGKRVLITGGAGFIGSHLARRLLAEGAEVTIVDSLIPEYGGNLANIADLRDRVWLNITDMRDEHGMRYLAQGQDLVFNLAGQTSHLDSMKNPFPDLEINCAAQLSLLEVCRQFNPRVRIVFASTRQIYGKPIKLPTDEHHPLKPTDINGIHKLAGEMYHQLFWEVYGIETVCLRLTNTYGPGMRIKDARQTFLGEWVRRILEESPIQVWGGEQLRDFNYVDDVVDAMIACATQPTAVGRVFNLGGGEIITLAELAKLLVDLAGKGEYEITPFPEERKSIDIGDYYADYTLISQVLGWEPKISIREGLTKTLRFFAERMEDYR